MRAGFKKIPGFPDYAVSKKGGLVLSLRKDKILKPQYNIKGYLRVNLGRENRFFVHRLVALAWKRNPKNKPQVHHKDFDILNNDADNLQWCTNSENQIFNVRRRYLSKEEAGTPF